MHPQALSSVRSHIPAVITGVTVATVIISLHLYIQNRQKDQKQLKRSNARRIRPRRSSPQRNSTSPNAQTSALTPGTTVPVSAATAAAIASQITSNNVQANAHPVQDEPHREPHRDDISDNDGQILSTQQLEEQLQREEAVDNDDDDDDFSTGFEPHQDTIAPDHPLSTENTKENQNLLNLLYLIAEDQAKREGYVHHGVSCYSCSVQPIRGIRYRCANCVDFDLCEHCESLESHPRTHLFYKVRIPAQFLGNPRNVQPPSYPGKPSNMPLGLGMELVKEFEKKSGFDQAEVEALYEQFKCLAATEYPNDPYRIGGAINRKTFDKCIHLSFPSRPPPPNLIYDRMFALYDNNNDGLIGFEEFILALAALHTKPRLDEKWKRIFKGYDLDGDGYVERKDFLKMFRAYYALSKERVQDVVARMEEEMIESGASTNVLLGSQPISAAFPSLSLEAHVGEGKSNTERDLEMLGNVILPSGNDEMTKEDMERFRADTYMRDPFILRGFLSQVSTPAGQPTAAEVIETEIEDDTHHSEALNAAPPEHLAAEGEEDVLSDNENIPPAGGHPATTATDMLTCLDDHSDSYTLGPEAEDDVGNEVLYQVTQQGLNELLNLLFKAKEDAATEVRKRQQRREKEENAKKAAQGTTPDASNIASETNVSETNAPPSINNPAPLTPSNSNITPHAKPSSPTSSPPLEPTTPLKANSALTGPKTQSKYELHRLRLESDQDKWLDKIEAEIKERRGPGKINYEEFERLMKQDGWRKFAFVGSWVDIVSF